MYHERTKDAAKGQWRGILQELGVPATALRDKQGPCPLCGGNTRFRFDNKEGDGTWICNHCGAGDGMKLAMEFLKTDFKDVAARIDDLLGNHKFGQDPIKPEMTEQKRRALLREVWKATRPVQPGDLVDAYLQTRDLGEKIYPADLRFAESLKDGEGGVAPAMVAMVRGPDGKPATLHRTFLKRDGSAKADLPSPRKMMPGETPDGSCVRLFDWSQGSLGIAEGIETAMAAGNLYEIQTWAALNAVMLAKWLPPEGCAEVAIFSDNDANFTGQAAAYRLANRLAIKGVQVSVHIPELVGEDWADVWSRRKR